MNRVYKKGVRFVSDCIHAKQTAVVKLGIGNERIQIDVKFFRHGRRRHYQTQLSQFLGELLLNSALTGASNIQPKYVCRAVLLAKQHNECHLPCLEAAKPINFVI